MRNRTIAIALVVCLVATALGILVWQQRTKRDEQEAEAAKTRRSAAARAEEPSTPSKKERLALVRLAGEIEGAVIYTRRHRVKKVTIGDWSEVDLGKGDYVRWGPLGRRIAVLDNGVVSVMNADGSDRETVVDGGVKGGDGCMIEFHTNGREILYGTRREGLWSVDIASKKTRSMNLPLNTEFNISADGRRLVGRRGGCYLVGLPGTEMRKFASGCSPCVSPDGTRMTSNIALHRRMAIHEWNGEPLFEINTKGMRPDSRWDNMHWSNHNDFIAIQGDGERHEVYAFRPSTNQGTRLTWMGSTKYPDLFVSRDLETGESPMEFTLAWAEANAEAGVID